MMIAKRSKRRMCALIICLPCLLILLVSSVLGDTAPREAVQAAKNGLGSLLRAIPPGDLRYYGFSVEGELTQATLGSPVRVSTINPDRLLRYTEQTELASFLSPTQLWFFPVLYLGEVKTILTVDTVNGKSKAVAIGSSRLARQLKRVQDTWPESEGYEHTFVRIYQAQSDFVVLSKEGTIGIVPLESAKIALRLETLKEGTYESYSPSDILPRLIPIVRLNLELHETIED